MHCKSRTRSVVVQTEYFGSVLSAERIWRYAWHETLWIWEVSSESTSGSRCIVTLLFWWYCHRTLVAFFAGYKKKEKDIVNVRSVLKVNCRGHAVLSRFFEHIVISRLLRFILVIKKNGRDTLGVSAIEPIVLDFIIFSFIRFIFEASQLLKSVEQVWYSVSL